MHRCSRCSIRPSRCRAAVRPCPVCVAAAAPSRNASTIHTPGQCIDDKANVAYPRRRWWWGDRPNVCLTGGGSDGTPPAFPPNPILAQASKATEWERREGFGMLRPVQVFWGCFFRLAEVGLPSTRRAAGKKCGSRILSHLPATITKHTATGRGRELARSLTQCAPLGPLLWATHSKAHRNRGGRGELAPKLKPNYFGLHGQCIFL